MSIRTRVFADVAIFNALVSDTAHMEDFASLACRSASAKRGVAHLSSASDVLEQPQSKRSKRNRTSHSPNDLLQGSRLPDEAQLDRAAEILNGARRGAIHAGYDGLNAGVELEQTAELLGAPVAKALLGKAVLPDRHPYTMDAIGILGTAPSQQSMQDCDALLIVGSTFPYIDYYPQPGQARGMQIDNDAQRIGMRYPVEAGLGGCGPDAADAERPVAAQDRPQLF